MLPPEFLTRMEALLGAAEAEKVRHAVHYR